MKRNPVYYEAIRQLALRCREWAAANPDKNPKVQFNYPEDVSVVAILSVAIQQHYISVDDDGRALIDFLVAGVPENMEPTPTMLRIALDIMNHPDLDQA